MDKHDYFYMNPAELLDKVFDIYKKSFWYQILMYIIVSVVLSGITFVFTFAGVLASAMAFLSNQSSLSIIFIIIISALAVFIIMTASSAVSAGSICIAGQVFYGEKNDLSKAFSDMFKSIPRIITVTIAQIFIFLPFILAIVYALFNYINQIIGYYVGSLYSESFPVYKIIIILIALVAMFFISNITAVSLPVALYEKKHFFSPVKKSWLLIKSEYWKILGIRLIFVLITNILSYSVSMLYSQGISVVNTASDFTVSPAYISTLYQNLALQLVVNTVISALISPFDGILAAVIYFNQRIKKDGLDIEIGLCGRV